MATLAESGAVQTIAEWKAIEEGYLTLQVPNSEGAEMIDTGIKRPLNGDWERITFRVDELESGYCDIFLGGVLVIGDVNLHNSITSSGFAAISFAAHSAAGCFLDGVSVSPSNPLFPDEDRDGILDRYELLTGMSPERVDRKDDSNGNGISNIEEFIRDLHAFDTDADGDGAVDGIEARVGLDPSKRDTNGARGLVSRHSYFEVKGNMAAIKRSGRLGRKAEVSDFLLALEQPTGSGNDFATRVRGFIVPPVTGQYRFWVAGDDQCEFWLSSDESCFSKRLVAKVSRYTGFRKWHSYEDQVSGAISLEAGSEYYIELLHRQGDGDGHFSVAWEVPGGYREVIESPYLRAYEANAADGDDDGLPDAWEQENGLDTTLASGSDDPDGDGILNDQEFRVGSNPNRSDAEFQAGLVRYEVWTDVRGEFPQDLKQHERFPGQPTSISYLERFETPVDQGEHFGARLRGYIRAPMTGDYQFWISGDNRGELWLGTNANKFEKRQIASLPNAVGLYEWGRHSEQASESIRLLKGRLYYIEAIHKEGTDFDHLAVAWQPPGDVRRVIEGADLVAYSPRSEDADDDDLKDAEESRFGLDIAKENLEANIHSAYGDLDGDGIDNETELRKGSDPTVAEKEHTTPRIPWECWSGIDGYTVGDLTENEAFPKQPDRVMFLDRLDTRRGFGDNYGSRVRGYIIPPTTDTYTFVLSGDNSCEFWLSDGESPFRRERLAEIREWTYLRHWKDYPSQQTRPVELAAGQRYYFEILHKEAEGEDYFSLAWESSSLPHEIIPADFLRKYSPVEADGDDDGLPDTWEIEIGLDNTSSSFADGSFGDPDGDLLSNYIEYRLGTNPKKPDAEGRKGIVLWEKWDGISGRSVDSFVENKRFLGPPTEAHYRTELSSLQGLGDDFGARMRGYIVAPETGEYTFAITSDDASELWISSDESKFNRSKVSAVHSWSGYSKWDREPGQAAQLELKAGQRYFFEVLHKEGIWQDHVSVAWKTPVSETFEVIQGNHLISFAGDPNDIDDDYLPDDWEQANGLRIDANGEYISTEGRFGDLDGDGLTNLEEWKLNTRADVSDSDADGLDDYLEAKVLATQPNQSDVGELRLVTAVNGVDCDVISGQWWSDDNIGVFNGTLMGALGCSLEVPEESFYLLGLDFRIIKDGGLLADPFDFVITIDGRNAGRKTIAADSGSTGRFKLLTPWLTRGTHQVGIRFVNAHPERRVSVDRLSLESVGGVDADGNGRSDWVDARLGQSRVEHLQTESFVSPAFVEGSGSPAMVGASSSGGTLEINAAPNNRWYTNVPLTPGQATALALSFPGGLSESGSIRWIPTDILAGGESLIRTGDSLLITAGNDGASGTFRIVSGKKQIFAGSLGEAAPVSFVIPGVYWLHADAVVDGRRTSAAHQVMVWGGAFNEANWFARGHTSIWPNPSLPTDAFLEFDDHFIWNRHSAEESSLSIIALERQPAFGVARLFQNGPILAQQRLNVLEAFSGSGTRIRYVENLGNGSYLVEMPVTLTDVPPDIRVVVEIFVPGVVFDDGTMIKELAATDFDQFNTSLVYFMMAAEVKTSVCHRIKVYEGNRLIAYYE